MTAVPVLQVSGVLSQATLAAAALSLLAGMLPLPAPEEGAAPDELAGAAAELVAVALAAPAPAEVATAAGPEVAGVAVLLLPLHADTDSAAVRASTAPV